MVAWLIPLFVSLVVFAALFWVLRQVVARWMSQQITQSLNTAQEQFLLLAEQRLATQHVQQTGELEAQKREVEKVVEGLGTQLSKYEILLRQVERDRATKYGALEQQMTAVQSEMQRVHQTNQQLTSMLGNAKVRGQWGEKTADDILRVCGLREGVHYEKQRNAPLGRPDFTFRLPDGHACYMDVKFPLDHYIKYCNSDKEEDRRNFQDQFLKAVRGHVKTLEQRDYAQPAAGSPDYVFMFIPNEQVYGAVNEWMPGLIDETLSKKIILCGPWTLYAQVRLMWQAWQNYYQGQTLTEVVKTVGEFLKTYQLFKERMVKLGEALDAAAAKYREVTQTSFVQLERKIERIERYRVGESTEKPDSGRPQAELLITKETVHDRSAVA